MSVNLIFKITTILTLVPLLGEGVGVCDACSQNEVHGSSVVKRNIVYDAGLLICPATSSQTAAGIIETFKFSLSLFSRSRS